MDGSKPSYKELEALIEELRRQVAGLSEARRSASAHGRLDMDAQGLEVVTQIARSAIVSIDETGKVVFWNPAAERMFGYAASEAVGRRLEELILPEEMRKKHSAGLERYLRTGKGSMQERPMELTGVRKSGEAFPMETVIASMQTPYGWRAVGILRDLTAFKKTEALLKRRAEFETLAGSLADLLVSAGESEMDDRTVEALNAVGGFLGFHRGHLVVLNEAGRRVAKARVWESDCAPPGFPELEGLLVRDVPCLNKLVERGEAFFSKDVSTVEDGELRGHLEGMGAGAFVWIPFLRGGTTVGCLGFEGPSAVGDLEESDLHQLRALGGIFHTALERAKVERAMKIVARDLDDLAQERDLLLDSIHDAVYKHDRQGVFTYMSPAIEAITGHPVQDWLKHYTAYLTDDPVNEKVVEYTEETLRTGKESPPYLVEVFHRKGDRISLEVVEKPYFEDGEVAGIIGVARDVTERTRNERELQMQRELLENVITHSPLHVFWKNRSSVYLGCNRNFARAVGLEDPAEIVGKTDYELAWKEGKADFYRGCDLKVMETGEPMLNLEETQPLEDGREALLLSHKVPLRDRDGNVFGVLGVHLDITERKKMEEELNRRRENLEDMVNEKTRELREANEALRKANKEAEFFVDLLSHDLTNFNQTVLGNLNLLRAKAGLEERFLKYLDASERQVIKSENLISRMRVSSRLKNVDFDRLRSGDLNRTIAEAIQTVQRMYPAKALDIAFKPDGRKNVRGLDLLDSVVMNLIENAAKHAKERASQIEVSVGEALEGGEVWWDLRVADTGQGIPDDLKEKVFERYSKIGMEKGMGLGLSLAREIVERLGGRIWVENRIPGRHEKGSVFKLRLPKG